MSVQKPIDQMSREEMAAELAALREYKGPDRGQSPNPEDEAERRASSQRMEFEAKLEFIGDFDILQAKGINISKDGIAFAVDQPLIFDIKVEVTGGFRQHRGRLVWVQASPHGGSKLGLEFIENQIEKDF